MGYVIGILQLAQIVLGDHTIRVVILVKASKVLSLTMYRVIHPLANNITYGVADSRLRVNPGLHHPLNSALGYLWYLVDIPEPLIIILHSLTAYVKQFLPHLPLILIDRGLLSFLGNTVFFEESLILVLIKSRRMIPVTQIRIIVRVAERTLGVGLIKPLVIDRQIDHINIEPETGYALFLWYTIFHGIKELGYLIRTVIYLPNEIRISLGRVFPHIRIQSGSGVLNKYTISLTHSYIISQLITEIRAVFFSKERCLHGCP